MRIAFFDATPKWSGGANRVLFLARELKSAGAEPLIVCLPGSVLSARAMSSGINVINVKPLSDIGLVSFFKILRLLKKYAVEIVDINSPKFYWLGLYAAKILGIKAILTRNVPYRKKGIKKLLNGMFLYKRCDAVISLSNKIRAELENDFGAGNVRVIYDGLLNEPNPINESEAIAARRRFGFSSGDIVFGTIGRLEESKGQIFAVEAVALVVQRHKNVRLLIAGSGDESYKKRIDELISRKNLDGIVVTAGFVDDITGVYAAIDILIQPSLYDNIPFSILEAFGYKKPVVASRVGGIPEVVDDGVNGYLTEPSDPCDLAEKMNKMIESDYRGMGAKGFDTVLKKFSKERMSENYKELLNELLKQ